MADINIDDLPPLDDEFVGPAFFADETETPDQTALLMLTGLAEIHRFDDGAIDFDTVGAIFAKAPTEHHLTSSFLIIEALLTLLHVKADLTPSESIEAARQYLQSAFAAAHDNE